jgi:HPt (histidine-containing phosphotransfer) domain-containing protein
MNPERQDDSGLHLRPEVTRAEEFIDQLERRLFPVDVVQSPQNEEHERCVVGNLLDRSISGLDLFPLQKKHFLTLWLADAFEAACDNPDVQTVQSRLLDAGYSSRVVSELHSLADSSPVLSVPILQQHAHGLVEQWRQRELGAVCERSRASMFAGLLSFDEAVAELRNVVLKVRG